jgi:predicted transcriptional regulator
MSGTVYWALQWVGLVTECEGHTIKASERKLKPRAETYRKHTYYVAADIAEELPGEIDREVLFGLEYPS